MEIIKLNQENTIEVAKIVAMIIMDGGLIVYPTDTVYGLGADATNDKAVEKLWEFKGERGDKPVLLAVSDEEMAEKVIKIDDLGKKLIRKYWPGSVSVVGVSKNEVAKKVQGDKSTLGVRMPDNDFVLELVSRIAKPMTSTSANVSGGNTCRTLAEFVSEVPADKMQLIDCFVDGGELSGNLPSTIVDISEGKIRVVRQGEVVVEV